MTPERIAELRALVMRCKDYPPNKNSGHDFIEAAEIALPEALDAIERARDIVDLLKIYAFGCRERVPFDSKQIDDMASKLLAALEGKQ